ncbi:Glycosyl transferase group 2 family protein [Mucinivorans hirudinis]|uniref:Glycosyl transferase group 2 family protein n=1 Tax=Mucinivorans hirudinis TaxID=1433126 RepID=A0A060R613_9BACT|nr:Glycosyl transferase group 2 family protein [Mucinivorans hirudinis]
MTQKKLSIITVVWNAAAELERTLANIYALKTPEIESIVIDGGSTDGTREVIERYAPDYWVSERDNGLYDAMNKGIEAANGKYIWFVNAGDRIHQMPQLEDKDIYFGETLITDMEGCHLGLRSKRLPEHLTWRSLVSGMVVCHQSFIVRREIAPLYNLEYRYAADIEWVIECLERARTIENTHLILSEFAEGGISTANRYASLRERWRIMVAKYGFFRTVTAHIGFVLAKPFGKKYRQKH